LSVLLRLSGKDGVRMVNGMDRQTLEDVLSVESRAATDGGTSDLRLGDEFRAAVARASRTDGVSYGEIDQAVRRIDGLSGRNREEAMRFVTDTNGDGLKAISNLKSESELQKLVSITYRGEINGNSAFVDNSLAAQDMVFILENNGDVGDLLGVVKPTDPANLRHDGTAIWLEEGNLKTAAGSEKWVKDNGGTGWEHIRNNHIQKPSGNDFARKFGHKYQDEYNIKSLIMESVKNGEPVLHDGDIIYVYHVDGGTISTVVGDNGYIITSVPNNLAT